VKHYGRIMLLTLSLGLFAVVMSSVPSHPTSAAATPPAINVDVVNTPTVNAHITNTSIPVTGSVNTTVTGTVNANITNASVPVSGTVAVSSLPAVTINGTPSVEVTNFPPMTTSGSVTVSNTPTTAIPVVIAPAASALFGTSCITTFGGSSNSASCPFAPAVTSGMTLYVESASIYLTVPTGDAPFQTSIYWAGNNAYIPMFLQASAGGTDYYIGALNGHFFVSSNNTSFNCDVSVIGAPTEAAIYCAISGYLVPTQ
jgi:hypothetical protein